MHRGVVSLMLCAALAACQKGPPEEVDAEAVDAVEAAAEDALNAPAYAVLAALRRANEEAQVGWDALAIPGPEGEAIPVNWWLEKRGLIDLSGAQFAARAAFILSKPAQAMMAAPDQPWFEAASSGEPKLDCENPAALAAGGCELKLQITPAFTPEGRSAVGQPATPLRAVAVTAVVVLGADGWRATELSAEGASLPDIGLAAILGPPDQRRAAEGAANAAMKARLASMAGETEPVVNTDAYSPPPYIEPPPAVAPLQPPMGPQTSPFRPSP